MTSRWQPLELPDGSYSDDTRPWSQQDVVGYLPTFAEMSGTRSRVKLVTVPGLNPFNVCGSGPHRGIRNVEGKLFVVSGQTLFQVFTDGSVQERGTIPGTGRVSMTHNQVAGGNQLLIGTVSNSYVWDTSDSTLTANGVPLLSVDFLNQLCLGVDSQRRFWRYSGLADATDWNTLDNESAESSPDRIVGGIVSQGEWLVFGERTAEVWLNSPTDATAFQRGPVIEKGCANANTIQRLDNSVIWLGNDNIVYRMQGYTPVPISTKAMAASLEASSQAKAFAFTYEDRGYAIYYLTFQDGKTWGYDVTNQRWHRRHSMDLERWRLNTLVRWNGGWYGGDYTNGTLHRLVWRHALEGDDYLPRSFSSGVMHGDGNRVRVAAVKILVGTGGEPSVSDEVIGLEGDLPNGYEGQSVNYSYTPVAGTEPSTYAITSGALPTGVSLPDADEPTLTGTFTTAGAYSWSITRTDSNGDTAILNDSATVTVATVAQSILVKALVWYDTAEASGSVAIEEVSGLDGAYYGVGLYSYGTPPAGGAKQFNTDSNARMETPSLGLDTLRDDFSIVTWAYATDTSTNQNVFNIRYLTDGGLFGKTLTKGAGGNTGNYVWDSSYGCGAIPLSQWTMLTLHKGGNEEVILQNTTITRTLSATPAYTANLTWYIEFGGLASQTKGFGKNDKGALSQFIVFKPMLTDEELAYLYNEGAGMTYAELLTAAGA